MRKVTYSMGISLDGYITGPDGSFDWADPSLEVFNESIDEIRDVDVHLLGRKIYESMLYWETADQDPELSADEHLWTQLWKELPKVVFSSTLTEVEGNARLATASLADEIAQLREQPGGGDIAIAGATLAAQAHELGLIDEYLIRIFPVLVGGGHSYFSHAGTFVGLELVETRTFDNGVLFVRYRATGGR